MPKDGPPMRQTAAEMYLLTHSAPAPTLCTLQRMVQTAESSLSIMIIAIVVIPLEVNSACIARIAEWVPVLVLVLIAIRLMQ